MAKVVVGTGTVNVSANTTQMTRQVKAALQNASANAQITLNTKGFSAPLGRITNDINQFQGALDASISRTLAFGASVQVIGGATRAFRDLVLVTADVEQSLKEVNVLLGLSTKSLSGFSGQLFSAARASSSAFNDAASAAAEFARQGLSVQETLQRTRDALILTKLSGLDLQKSVEGITATINGFNDTLLDSTIVINKLANVDAAFAVSSADLVNALSRSGAAAQSAKVGLDELLAVTTAVQQRTARGGNVIGNGFKTIFTRIQRSGVQDVLEDIGVATKDLNGDFRGAIPILKDYAAVYKTLSDTQKAYTAEQIAGVFQINNLKALISDLNSETSVFSRALATAGQDSNSAYERIEELNTSLKNLGANLKTAIGEFGSTLGGGSFSEPLKDLTKGVTGIFDGLTTALKGESDSDIVNAGGEIAKGLLGGLSKFILGPGLFIIGSTFLKLVRFLVSETLKVVRQVSALNTEAQQQKILQEFIVRTLQQNQDINRNLLALGRDEAKQEAYILGIFKQQVSAMREQEAIAKRLAATLSKTFVGNPSGRIDFRKGKSAAEGYVPNAAGGAVARENAAIKKGVGGAPKNAQPTQIRNFNFGNGKRGPIIANTSEYLVRGFNGGDAIFNQDMARKYGLPSGAKPIAAGGYVPNFAGGLPPLSSLNSTQIGRLKAGTGIKIGDKKVFAEDFGTTKESLSANPNFQSTSAKSAAKKTAAKESSRGNTFLLDDPLFGIISISSQSGQTTSVSKLLAGGGLGGLARERALSLFGLSSKSGKDAIRNKKITFSNVPITSFDKLTKDDFNQSKNNQLIGKIFSEPLINYGASLLGQVGINVGDSSSKVAAIQKLSNRTNPLAKATIGFLFEDAIKIATSSATKLPKVLSDVDNAPFDFDPERNVNPTLKKALGLPESVSKADAKRTANQKTVGTVIKKALNDNNAFSLLQRSGKRVNAAKGFIPRSGLSAQAGARIFDSDMLGGFQKAKPILDKVLSTPPTVRKDLFIGPAGSGKTTAALKSLGGKKAFIKNSSDVESATAFLILSGAGLTKNGDFSPDTIRLIQAAKSSGGSVQYAFAPNSELQKRREERAEKGGVDPRKKNALRGTIFSPKNKISMIKKLRRQGGEAFSAVNLAEGFDPLSQAISRELSATSANIRVQRDVRLKSKENPYGLAVTNKKDEPNGIRDLMSFARGYVPNFAGQFISDPNSYNIALTGRGQNLINQINQQIPGNAKRVFGKKFLLEFEKFADAVEKSGTTSRRAAKAYDQISEAAKKAKINLKSVDTALTIVALEAQKTYDRRIAGAGKGPPIPGTAAANRESLTRRQRIKAINQRRQAQGKYALGYGPISNEKLLGYSVLASSVAGLGGPVGEAASRALTFGTTAGYATSGFKNKKLASRLTGGAIALGLAPSISGGAANFISKGVVGGKAIDFKTDEERRAALEKSAEVSTKTANALQEAAKQQELYNKALQSGDYAGAAKSLSEVQVAINQISDRRVAFKARRAKSAEEFNAILEEFQKSENARLSQEAAVVSSLSKGIGSFDDASAKAKNPFLRLTDAFGGNIRLKKGGAAFGADLAETVNLGGTFTTGGGNEFDRFSLIKNELQKRGTLEQKDVGVQFSELATVLVKFGAVTKGAIEEIENLSGPAREFAIARFAEIQTIRIENEERARSIASIQAARNALNISTNSNFESILNPLRKASANLLQFSNLAKEIESGRRGFRVDALEQLGSITGLDASNQRRQIEFDIGSKQRNAELIKLVGSNELAGSILNAPDASNIENIQKLFGEGSAVDQETLIKIQEILGVELESKRILEEQNRIAKAELALSNLTSIKGATSETQQIENEGSRKVFEAAFKKLNSGTVTRDDLKAIVDNGDSFLSQVDKGSELYKKGVDAIQRAQIGLKTFELADSRGVPIDKFNISGENFASLKDDLEATAQKISQKGPSIELDIIQGIIDNIDTVKGGIQSGDKEAVDQTITQSLESLKQELAQTRVLKEAIEGFVIQMGESSADFKDGLIRATEAATRSYEAVRDTIVKFDKTEEKLAREIAELIESIEDLKMKTSDLTEEPSAMPGGIIPYGAGGGARLGG